MKKSNQKQQIDFYVLAPEGKKALPKAVLEAVEEKHVRYIKNFDEGGLEKDIPTITPSMGYVWGYGNFQHREGYR